MMLGVVLHAAAVYSPSAHWLVSDPEHDPIFGLLVDAIHVIRMPAFFWLSGYFTALALLRSRPGGYMRRRFLRIGVPLLTAWAVLNPIQLILAPDSGASIAHGPAGVPLFHLWFLVDLLVFTSLALLALPGERLLALAALLPSRGFIPLAAFFAVLAWLLSAAVRATGFSYSEPLGLTSAVRLASGLPFFAAGLLMYPRRETEDAFQSVPSYLWLATIPMLLWLKPMVEAEFDLISEPALLASIFVTFITIGSVIRCFRQLFGAISPNMRFWSDASYTVYLFHHLVVMFVALSLISLAWAAPIKFLITCTVGLALPLALHQIVVRRSILLGFLFNGKPAEFRPATQKPRHWPDIG